MTLKSKVEHRNISILKTAFHEGDIPMVKVGIISAEKIEFTLNAPYSAKGNEVTGPQTVEISEGGILWNGNHYSHLTFHPTAEDSSFSISDVIIGIHFFLGHTEFLVLRQIAQKVPAFAIFHFGLRIPYWVDSLEECLRNMNRNN